MTARYTGTVSHIDADGEYAEITAAPFGAVSASLLDLRRVGADALGKTVDFEQGVLAGGNSGAVNIRNPWP